MATMIFWDVDTQVDFMTSEGLLYVPGAEAIIANLKRLTDYAHASGIPIVASADDHEPGHRELSAEPDFRETFPLHCMRGTPGQAKIAETSLKNPMVIEPEAQDPDVLTARVRAHRGDFLLHKHWFDVFTNQNTDTLIEALAPASITLYGVALDVCNRYAIEGIVQRYPKIRLFAVTDAMKPINAGIAEELLREWGDEGVRLVTTDEAVGA